MYFIYLNREIKKVFSTRTKISTLDCNKKWVICLLTGNISSKQFVGSSTGSVRYRWDN